MNMLINLMVQSFYNVYIKMSCCALYICTVIPINLGGGRIIRHKRNKDKEMKEKNRFRNVRDEAISK